MRRERCDHGALDGAFDPLAVDVDAECGGVLPAHGAGVAVPRLLRLRDLPGSPHFLVPLLHRAARREDVRRG